MLLDSASMYFRTFYGVPDSVRAPDGRPVNAVRGFLDAIGRLVSNHRPTHLTATFDADWRPAFRVALLPSYKTHRLAAAGELDAEEVPDLLAPQVPVIRDVLEALGVAQCELAGFEADDVIGTLATTSQIPVDIVTGDRDLFQLVDDGRGVRVLYTAKGFGRLEVVDDDLLQTRYGVPARLYADFAALRGDPSDGLPGVKGVGDKTAAGLVQTLGSVEQILLALEAGDGEVPHRAKLEAARDYLAVAPDVVRVRRDLPLAEVDDALATSRRRMDPERLEQLAERYGLASSVRRVVDAITEAGTATA
jgi:5'-3' exonuclease